MQRGDSAELHVAKKRLRRVNKLFAASAVTALVAGGGFIVAGATGHDELVGDGAAVWVGAVVVEFGVGEALQKRRDAVRRIEIQNQGIFGL